MAAGTDFSPPFTILEGGYNKDISAMEDEIPQNSENLKQTANGKPPRHVSVSVLRHCISSTTLAPAADMDFDLGAVGIRSPSDAKLVCLPVFQSGSCAEKGPKQYMENEHICIDNLPEHLCATAGFPSPGAFYGVFDGHGGTDAAAFI